MIRTLRLRRRAVLESRVYRLMVNTMPPSKAFTSSNPGGAL
jgi:hypothetical protein